MVCFMANDALFQDLRPATRDLPQSGIVELINAGRDVEGLIPLWIGEGHHTTPDFICNAAIESLRNGETFYTHQRGISELRQALADYHTTVYGKPFSSERFFVTGSGMQAVQLAFQSLAGHGDEMIIPTPAWPNFEAAARIAGATPVTVPMRFENEEWSLSANDIRSAISENTRAIYFNSPSNPTGWVASHTVLREILDIARETDTWIIADEVYHRFYYEGQCAPSFYDVMDDTDKIIFVNTFSKNWAMTGWRIGWISASPSLGQVFENLIQFSTSGVPVFAQRAAVEALKSGEW